MTAKVDPREVLVKEDPMKRVLGPRTLNEYHHTETVNVGYVLVDNENDQTIGATHLAIVRSPSGRMNHIRPIKFLFDPLGNFEVAGFHRPIGHMIRNLIPSTQQGGQLLFFKKGYFGG
jgi:hypothetical protein